MPTTTYRTKAYLDAARRVGVDVVAASEWPSTLAAHNPKGLLTLDLFNADEAARQAQQYANEYAIDAVIPVDEDTAVAAAAIADGLRLNYNPPAAARAAKNKRLMREVLSRAGVRVPRYQGLRGHPVWFHRHLLREFLEIPEGGAANQIVRSHAAETEFLDVDDPGILADIDDAAAYVRLTGVAL